MVVITVAITINVSRVSSIQLLWYFMRYLAHNPNQRYLHHFLNLDDWVAVSTASLKEFCSVCDSKSARVGRDEEELIRFVHLFNPTSLKMSWIPRYLKSLGKNKHPTVCNPYSLWHCPLFLFRYWKQVFYGLHKYNNSNNIYFVYFLLFFA